MSRAKKTCPLCEKGYPKKKVIRRYGLLQRICPGCYAKYRRMQLEIFCTDTVKSFIPVLGAKKYRITGFARNVKGKMDYSQPFLKPSHEDRVLEIVGSSEKERTQPPEDFSNQNISSFESDLSARLIDEAPLLPKNRSPVLNRVDAQGSEHEVIPERTALSPAPRDALETHDRLHDTTQRLSEADERLRLIEIKLRETENRLCKSENKVAYLEDERVRMDKQMADMRSAMGGVCVLM